MTMLAKSTFDSERILQDIEDEDIKEFLTQEGWSDEDIEKCIDGTHRAGKLIQQRIDEGEVI